MGCAASGDVKSEWKPSNLTQDQKTYLVQELRSNEYFKYIDEKTLQSFVDKFEVKRFTKNELVFSDNQTSDYMYFVLSGRMIASQQNSQGKSRSITKGAIVGEHGMIHSLKRHYSLKCESQKADILRLSKVDFKSIQPKGIKSPAPATNHVVLKYNLQSPQFRPSAKLDNRSVVDSDESCDKDDSIESPPFDIKFEEVDTDEPSVEIDDDMNVKENNSMIKRVSGVKLGSQSGSFLSPLKTVMSFIKTGSNLGSWANSTAHAKMSSTSELKAENVLDDKDSDRGTIDSMNSEFEGDCVPENELNDSHFGMPEVIG